MRIKFLEYAIVAEGSHFNIVQERAAQKIGTGTMSKPNGAMYMASENIAFGVDLDGAIEKIIKLTINCKNRKNEALTLKEYLTEYTELRNQARKEFKELLSVKK
jgi:hypothetical protein